MENPQYEQLKLWYTQEEVDAKVSEARAEATTDKLHTIAMTAISLRDKAIEWFKSEVRGGSMDKDDALGIFNGLADALNWDLLDNLTSTYSVTVSVNDVVVGTFEGVEADDEDEACDKVIEEAEAYATFEVSFNNDTITQNLDSWSLEVTAEAVEE